MSKNQKQHNSCLTHSHFYFLVCLYPLNSNHSPVFMNLVDQICAQQCFYTSSLSPYIPTYALTFNLLAASLVCNYHLHKLLSLSVTLVLLSFTILGFCHLPRPRKHPLNHRTYWVFLANI